jgi:two-component system, LytTR family, response regulator
MNCVVIDDEPLAIDIVEKYVKRTEGLTLLRSFQNAFEALYFVQTQAVDLIFLDIQMAGINGLQFIKILKYPPKVIITTAYKEFALEALHHAVIDYLLKPITYDRFLEAVSKAIEIPAYVNMLQSSLPDITRRTYFFFKEGGTYEKVYLDDIYYIHGDRNYCTIHFKEGKLNVRGNLSFYGNRIEMEGLMRVHRSYFVSLHRVDRYDSDVLFTNGVSIPIGRTYKKTVMDFLARYTL